MIDYEPGFKAWLQSSKIAEPTSSNEFCLRYLEYLEAKHHG